MEPTYEELLARLRAQRAENEAKRQLMVEAETAYREGQRASHELEAAITEWERAVLANPT